jgi:acetyl-CoA C-acetyltransferase
VPAVVDPRAPVVVGVGQTSQRVSAEVARAPIQLFADAARLAEADAGAALLAKVDLVGVPAIGSWQYADPGAFVARELGISPRATAVSTVGGNSPLLFVNTFGALIQRAECDVALIGGAECMYTRWRARREPRVKLTWPTDDGAAPCAWVVGDDRPGSSPYEMAHLAVAPPMVYPLFETALRHELGHDITEHQVHVSELWSGFAAAAAANPSAWSRAAYTAGAIREVSAENRMICFPYPKLMCANIDVDQGAAFLMCAYETARAAGIPDDRIVFLHAGAQGHDHYFLTERASLTRSPAIAAAARSALESTGITPDDLTHVDLYSCFPSAVQIAAREIGIDDGRPLTVTGGLGFAGGPVNNYPTHAVARMVEVLRADPGTYGLTSALGWYVTKHDVCTWSTQPPAQPFAPIDVQDEVDRLPRREPAGLVDESATVEATSVAFERDGNPTIGILTALLDDGRRAIANVRDGDALFAMTHEPWEGRRVKLSNDGSANTIVT